MIYFFVAACFSAVCVYVCFGRKFFAVFQQCAYRCGEFFGALKKECKNEIEYLSTYSLTFFVYSLVFSPLFALDDVLFSTVFVLGTFAFALGVYLKNRPVKKVRITARFARMTFVSVLLFALSTVGFCYVGYLVVGYDIPLCLILSASITVDALTLPFFICAGCGAWQPYDRLTFAKSVKRCRRKLDGLPALIRIGITGSYGKTSVKNILEKMLSVKYRVVATPLSYNTPLGICKAAEKINAETEIFIAEMGARKPGDIKELCNIVRPDVGIITGICGQHLETFLSVENVKSTKNELIAALPLDGYAFFSADSAGSRELFEKCGLSKCLAGASGGEVFVESVEEREDGTHIAMNIGGKAYSFTTELRGRANAGNICLAAAVALKTGISPERIVVAAERLKPSPHRLEVIRANGVIIIDDSYNANVESVKAAAEVLGCFKGKKYVVTPGVVEGGASAEKINADVGEILSRVADEIIAVGFNSADIAEGADKGADKGTYKRTAVVEANNIEEAKTILNAKLKKGDAVLFLNDIPDRYGA